MEFLTVKKLCKVYGRDESQVTALDHVSLTIEKGEFTAIIGSSGSGKSTLLHCIAGVDIPTRGKIYLDGQDIYAQNNEKLAIFRRRQVGLIYQFYNLIPVLDVKENITLPVLMDGRKVNESRLAEMVKMLGLEGREGHLPNQLSGGQQQRVAVARALASKPAIILADEPTGNLDSKTGMDVISLLKLTSQEFHQTIVMITHNEEIALMADGIIRIEDGKIEAGDVIC